MLSRFPLSIEYRNVTDGQICYINIARQRAACDKNTCTADAISVARLIATVVYDGMVYLGCRITSVFVTVCLSFVLFIVCQSHISLKKFLKDYTILSKNGKNIVLCWIPSHVGIPGS